MRNDGNGPVVVYLSLEPLRLGQASQTHVQAIVDGLVRGGVHVTLVARHLAPEVHEGKLKRLAAYATLSIRAVRALRRATVIYVRSHPAAVLFAACARLSGKPVVHEINGRMSDIGVTYNLPTIVTRGLSSLQAWQFRRAAALIAVTPGLAQWAAALPGVSAPVHVVTNGADTATFRPDAPATRLVDPPYVLFFGGLTAWHGIETMLAAAARSEWPDDVRLVIAGEGWLSDKVRAAAGNGRVMAVGHLERGSLAGLACRAIAILCAIEAHGDRAEGGVAPLKLFEGMASGRPVIVTDLPFQADLVRETNCGLVIPVADPAALAAAVARLAANPASATEMGARGRRCVEQRFDWQVKADETAEILARAAQPGSAA